MDDTEDDARYPPKHYSVNNRSPFDSSARSKHSNRNPSYPTNNTYRDEDDEYEDDELEEEDQSVKQEFDDQDDDDEEEDEDEDEDEGDEEDLENGYDEPGRRQKKRRLDNLVSNYEFAPRKPPAAAARNLSVDWTDQATIVLLEAWGDRFLQLGRKTLRSEDWQDVAEKVSEGSKVDWTDSQCRNRLDTLKKKYKKEKAKIDSSGGGYSSKWFFFKKMDMLLNSSSSKQQVGLPCGVDSGEYVFMNPRVYLNRSNGLDELRDSPGESESSDDDDDQDLYGHNSSKGKGDNDGSSFKLLADSVHKFGEIYEKIESSKRQQMMDLEKMRMDFQRELEVQKKQILERAQAEIAKIREGDEEDETDGSAENFSG